MVWQNGWTYSLTKTGKIPAGNLTLPAGIFAEMATVYAESRRSQQSHRCRFIAGVCI